jgi:hypothetical protein
VAVLLASRAEETGLLSRRPFARVQSDWVADGWGLKQSRMACRMHRALKEMGCSSDGPNRVQTEGKRGVHSKNPESTA